MELRVSNAPRDPRILKVVSDQPGTISGVTSNTGMQGNTYNPQLSTYNPQPAFGGGGGGGNTGVLGLGTTTNYGSGGGGGGPVVPSAAEIAAQQAEAQRISNIRNMAGIKRGGIESGAQTALTDNRNTFNRDSTGLVTGIRQGQNTINTELANNALNLRRSMASIAGGVRQGLRSGGVDLANMNALDSGASDALARAWARVGGQQAGGAQNEAELRRNELASEQSNLDLQRSQGLSNLRTWRDTETARVSNKLYNSLQELEAESAAQGAGGVVNLGVRDQMINAAAAELDAIDRATQAALGEIRGLSPQEVDARAMQMEQAGAQVANPFAVEAVNAGIQPGMSGAPIGQFNTRPRFRDEERPIYNPFQLEEEQVA